MVTNKKESNVIVPLTIILLNEDCNISNLSYFITDYADENIILKDSNYILYKKNGIKDYPKWLKDFQKKVLNEPKIKEFYNKTISEGLTIIKEVNYNNNSYTFAINFGQGRHNIIKDKINNTFGIFVAQKILLSKKARVRIAQSRSIEGDPVNKNRMFAREIEQEALFALLDEDEVMRELCLLADKHSNEFSSIIGKYGPLNIKFKFKKNEVPCIKYLDNRLIQLLNLYNNISDNEISLLFKGLQPVNYNKSESLFKQLPEKLLDTEKNHFYFFEPEIDYDFMQIDYVKYQINDQLQPEEKEYDKLYAEDYLSVQPNPTLENLKNDLVVLYDGENHVCKKWQILETLYGEFHYEDGLYILSNKIWYKVEKNKYERINKIINEITDRTFSIKEVVKQNTTKSIIEYTKTDEYKNAEIKKIPRENIFNREFANFYKYTLLDKNLIKIEDSPLEICDVYNQEKNEFIHIKIGTSADSLSHLFAQGYGSARAYKTDPQEFVSRVNKLNNGNINIQIPANPTGAIINYVILNSKKVNELTFLSKMTLIEKIENLKAFGFRVKLTWINGLTLYPKINEDSLDE